MIESDRQSFKRYVVSFQDVCGVMQCRDHSGRPCSSKESEVKLGGKEIEIPNKIRQIVFGDDDNVMEL